MHDPVSPACEDAQAQAAVLTLVLTEHPTPLTLADIEREVAPNQDFAGRDAVARAVRDLVAVGLLHRQGDLVLPTRAALRFDGLDVDNR
jgi:hypothetical protein